MFQNVRFHQQFDEMFDVTDPKLDLIFSSMDLYGEIFVVLVMGEKSALFLYNFEFE